ncbi:hypothetical protein GH733_008358 [Mirounga leonina]|nr:hypothetical protein GH733_008358 [Mirounga leonina]
MASGDSPPAVRGASASLGSRPRSPNSLFAAEPPERLGVESCCDVAQHPGWRCRWPRLGSPAGSVRSVRGARARLRRSLPGPVSASWSLELQASVRVALKRVRLEVPEPNLGFLPIGAFLPIKPLTSTGPLIISKSSLISDEVVLKFRPLVLAESQLQPTGLDLTAGELGAHPPQLKAVAFFFATFVTVISSYCGLGVVFQGMRALLANMSYGQFLPSRAKLP